MEFEEVTIDIVANFGSHISFHTTCTHWHARPLTFDIKIGDKMVCPVCYPSYPESNERRPNRVTENGWIINDK